MSVIRTSSPSRTPRTPIPLRLGAYSPSHAANQFLSRTVELRGPRLTSLSSQRVVTPTMIRHIAFLSLLTVAAPLGGQTFPGSDYVIRNFKFESGETLPELRMHYITLGSPAARRGRRRAQRRDGAAWNDGLGRRIHEPHVRR